MNGLAIGLDQTALPHLICLDGMSGSLALGLTCNFFDNRSPSAAASRRCPLGRSHPSFFNRSASEDCRPPNFTFHGLSVALLIPCFRQTSVAETPLLGPRNISMISSSVNLDRFIIRPFLWIEL